MTAQVILIALQNLTKDFYSLYNHFKNLFLRTLKWNNCTTLILVAILSIRNII